MPRALTSEEAQAVAAKAKPNGSRPFIFDSSTGTLLEISKDFETFLILSSAGIKAQVASYIANILLFDINNLVVRNNLMKRWCEDEIKNFNNEIKGYQDILDQYDDIQPKLAGAAVGFEDVPEVNTLIQDFTLMLGDFVEVRDGLVFAKAAANVINTRERGKLPANLKQEVESYARALLTYE
jgi:hypothetical protein